MSFAWEVICPPAIQENLDPPACHLSPENLSSSKLLVSIVKQADDPNVMILRAPLGINLGPGVDWKVDNRKQREFIFNTCTNDGCFALVKLDLPTMTELKRGLVLRLTYADGRNEKNKSEVSLKGFTNGVRLLEK